jgi:hypothetical protein
MSDKIKTPIEELIQEMESLKSTKLYEGSFKAIEDCIHLAWAKLEKEKEYAKENFSEGWLLFKKNQDR